MQWLPSSPSRATTTVFTFTGSKVLQGEGGPSRVPLNGGIGEGGPM